MKSGKLPLKSKTQTAENLQIKIAASVNPDDASQSPNHKSRHIHDGGYNKSKGEQSTRQTYHTDQSRLSGDQQQFILKFCRQLASVIQACDQSEAAEIEVGRRVVGTRQIKVKLSARRES